MKPILILIIAFSFSSYSIAQVSIQPYVGINPGGSTYNPSSNFVKNLEPFSRILLPNGNYVEFITLGKEGVKYEIGVNLAKQITDRYSILTGLSFNLWKQRITYSDYSIQEYLPSVGINLGQQFIIKSFKKSSFFASASFNIERYGKSHFKNWSIAIEPSIGFSRMINSNNDVFLEIGYEKFLSNYS